MSVPRDVTTRPYAAIFRGRMSGLESVYVVISVHARVDLAERQCVKLRNLWRAMCGAYPVPFLYQIIDRRDGSIIKLIT